MNFCLKNQTSRSFICKTKNFTVIVKPYEQESIIIDADNPTLKIENISSSFIKKKWYGIVTHLAINTFFELNFAQIDNVINIYEKSIEVNEDIKYNYFYSTENLYAIKCDVSDGNIVLKKLLNREKIQFIMDILIFPLLYIILDKLILNRLWYFLLDILLESTYSTVFSIITYLFVLIINGILQCIEFFGENARKKRTMLKKSFDSEYIRKIYNRN